ncbi:MAG: DsbC family protein [Gammaproteobacteria bacterium]|nr:DsbC family protein [Gammaproteobacteria bacterium]
MPAAQKVLGLGVGLCVAAVAAAADQDDVASEIAECMATQGLPAESVVPAAAPGLFEVEVQGGDYLYVTPDCRYFIFGNLYEIQDDHRLVAVTEGRRSARRLEIVDGIAESDMLVFSPDGTPKASVLVFTDTDCGYCRQLHKQMPEYHALGIEIRYLAYPRAGVGSPSYDRMVSAWCAVDPLDALTRLKNGEEIPPRACVNPVAAQYQLGQDVGLSGTPTLVLADGRMLPGYTPPAQLAALLEL